MNIMFMTKFPDGTPTDFVGKIIQSCLNVPGEYVPYRIAKLHTIRQSKRIKKGMRLSMRYWKDKPYRSPQVEFCEAECLATQDISIRWIGDDNVKYPFVIIDEYCLEDDEVKRLAINDGFDSVEHFWKWFNKDFEGQIIHWTDLRY
jgi:hypothetical protein